MLVTNLQSFFYYAMRRARRPTMLSEVVKTEQYHFVTVLDENGNEEKWLLTDGDRERLRTRALNFMLRGGTLVRKTTFLESFLRPFLGR
jgi:hypothetical protein